MHLGPQLYSKKTPHRCFPVKCAIIFRTPFLKNICQQPFLSVIIGGKIFRNTSTRCKDCFLGVLKSDKKKKRFFYHWYENFKSFGCVWFWVIVGGFGCFWVVVTCFHWLWVVLAGCWWFWKVLGACMFCS